MKKIFRMAMVCTLAGATLLYTGCTKDYSEDIYELNQRVSTLENDTAVAKLQDEVSKLSDLVKNLQTAQGNLDAALANKADKTEVENLKSLVAQTYATKAELQNEIATINTALKAYAKLSDLDPYAKKADVTKEIQDKIAEALKGYYTKTQIDEFLAGKTSPADVQKMLENYYTKSQIEGMLASYYTKDKIDEILGGYYTKDQVFTKQEVNELLAGYYTQDQIDEMFEDYLTETEINALLSGYYTKGEADAKFATKAELNEAIADAVEAVEGKIAESADTLNKKIVAIEGRVDILEGDVATIKANLQKVQEDIEAIQAILDVISNMVQSISFVPEFDDLCANGQILYLEGEKGATMIGQPIVSGTFQVKPERLASAVAEAYENGELDVYLQLVNTSNRWTKAAEDYIKSDTLAIVSADNKTGYINVMARFAIDEKDSKALTNDRQSRQCISLWIEDAATEAAAEIGTNVASIYVPVMFEDNYISAEDYIYAAEDEEEGKTVIVEYGNDSELDVAYGSDYSHTEWMPWNDHTAVNFHENFQPMIVVDGEPMTCAEFEEANFLPEGAATPVIAKKENKYFDNGATADPAIEDEFVFTSEEEGVDEVIIAIAESSKPAWLYDNINAIQEWELNGEPIFKVADRFIVGFITTKTDILDKEHIAWTYDFAVKHSNTPEVRFGVPGEKIENVQPIVFKNKTVDKTLINTAALDTVTCAKVYSQNPETEEWILEPAMTVEFTKVDAEKVDISVSGYTFQTEKDAVQYKVLAAFQDMENASQTEAIYLFSLSKKPVKFEASRDIVIDYIPRVTTTQALAAEIPAELEADLLKYFKDDEDFLFGLSHSNVVSNAAKVTTGGVESACSEYSYLLFSETDGAQTRLSQADVKTYNDSYVYVAEIETWYDVDYKLTVNATLAEPGFGLAYWPDMVNLDDITAPYAIVKGKYALDPIAEEGQAGKPALAQYNKNDAVQYVITTDDLSKYYMIENFENLEDAEKELLTIVYKAVTEENIPEGYKNVPTVNSDPKDVDTSDPEKKYIIPSEKINWNEYTARDLDVVAELYCNGVLVNSCPLTLYIQDPIAKFLVKEGTLTVKRENYKNATAYLWKNFNITGVLEPNFCIINNNATNADEAFLYGNPYKAVLTFDKNDLKTYIGDELFEMVGTKITFDAANGIITYNDDSAWMQKPVSVKVKASLQHKFNYMWPEQETALNERNHVSSVEFTVVFEQAGVTPTPNAL